VDDGTNGPGSVVTYVDVPDFSKRPLGLSGIFLSVSPAESTTMSAGVRDLLPVTPTTRRTFAGAQQVTADVRLFEGGPDASASRVDVAAQVVDAQGRLALDEHATLPAEAFRRDHRSDYEIQLPLHRLTPGSYLLTIDATSGPAIERASVRFSVH
jgi:hypothetical protein